MLVNVSYWSMEEHNVLVSCTSAMTAGRRSPDSSPESVLQFRILSSQPLSSESSSRSPLTSACHCTLGHPSNLASGCTVSVERCEVSAPLQPGHMTSWHSVVPPVMLSQTQHPLLGSVRGPTIRVIVITLYPFVFAVRGERST